jgi:hypothetical protein
VIDERIRLPITTNWNYGDRQSGQRSTGISREKVESMKQSLHGLSPFFASAKCARIPDYPKVQRGACRNGSRARCPSTYPLGRHCRSAATN